MHTSGTHSISVINEQGVWPLEFTCRFGYPGFAICDALHEESWDGIFQKMFCRGDRQIKTRAGFALGVVLTYRRFPMNMATRNFRKAHRLFFAMT